jgi:hypothetical protein
MFIRAVCLLFIVQMGLPQAETIVVTKAETRISEDGYQLMADFQITLSTSAKEALDHGVSLYFVSEFTVTQPRWYWMNGEFSHSETIIKLSYNALTQQYKVGRGGLLQSFSNLPSALLVVGHQVATPVPFEKLNNQSGYFMKWIKPNRRFVASASMRLDISQLPKPLQVNALTGNDWDIHSEQYNWLIQPDSKIITKSEMP